MKKTPSVQAVPSRTPPVEIKVYGNLDAGAAPSVSYQLEEAMAQGPTRLIIDLAECDVIDAAGILLLLDAHRRAVRDGGSIALRSPSQRAQRNLRLARVDRVLQVIGSVDVRDDLTLPHP